MVRRIAHAGSEVFLCEVCGLGYLDRATADRCQRFCEEHNACSLEITRSAVYGR